MLTRPDKIKLHTLLGNYPNVIALKDGRLKSDLIEWDFPDFPVPNRGFKPMVREHRFDCGELAIVTFLQARSYGLPYVLLPATVLGRGQLHTVAYNSKRGVMKPSDLNGKKFGVRSYTQTTGIWVRAILGEDYGVDADTITWMCADGAHLAEYRDPPNVEHVDAGGSDLAELLATGRIDAAIFGADMPKDRDFVPLIPDPDAAARNWLARHRYVPVNHLLAIGRDIAESHPEQVRALYRLFSAAKAQAPTDRSGIDFLPLGFDALRAPVEAMIEHCLDQKIIPRRLSFDAVFGQARRLLDA